MTTETKLEFTLGNIPKEEAKKMITNYVMKIPRDSDGVHENTISVWFSIEVLRELMSTLEEELTNSTPGEETDGVRIYFANYGSKPPKDEPEKAHKNTVVLISTRKHKDKEGFHKDYFTEKHRVEPLNRGGLCPPEKGCDCDTEIIDPLYRPICGVE